MAPSRWLHVHPSYRPETKALAARTQPACTFTAENQAAVAWWFSRLHQGRFGQITSSSGYSPSVAAVRQICFAFVRPIDDSRHDPRKPRSAAMVPMPPLGLRFDGIEGRFINDCLPSLPSVQTLSFACRISATTVADRVAIASRPS